MVECAVRCGCGEAGRGACMIECITTASAASAATALRAVRRKEIARPKQKMAVQLPPLVMPPPLKTKDAKTTHILIQ